LTNVEGEPILAYQEGEMVDRVRVRSSRVSRFAKHLLPAALGIGCSDGMDHPTERLGTAPARIANSAGPSVTADDTDKALAPVESAWVLATVLGEAATGSLEQRSTMYDLARRSGPRIARSARPARRCQSRGSASPSACTAAEWPVVRYAQQTLLDVGHC
jgi:hypothetical protein